MAVGMVVGAEFVFWRMRKHLASLREPHNFRFDEQQFELFIRRFIAATNNFHVNGKEVDVDELAVVLHASAVESTGRLGLLMPPEHNVSFDQLPWQEQQLLREAVMAVINKLVPGEKPCVKS